MSNDAHDDIVVETGGEAARRLAIATAASHDLAYVGHLCQRLLEMAASHASDIDLVKAFWTTALVHYARAFERGAEIGLMPENAFAPAAGEPLAAHHAYLDWAGWEMHGAADPFERVRVGLALSSGEERAVRGTGVFLMQRGVTHHQGIEQLGRLVDMARAEIARLGKDLEHRVAEAARAEPLDSIYARPRFEPGK